MRWKGGKHSYWGGKKGEGDEEGKKRMGNVYQEEGKERVVRRGREERTGGWERYNEKYRDRQRAYIH